MTVVRETETIVEAKRAMIIGRGTEHGTRGFPSTFTTKRKPNDSVPNSI